eukprot:c21553_g1_i2 orf=363-743(+)
MDETAANKASAGPESNAGIDDAENEGGTDEHKPRPMSPGTLALMCDEQDTLFTAPPSPVGAINGGTCTAFKPSSVTRLYAEQEKAVLSEFRDCLRRIISVGKKRATQYSTEAARVELAAATSIHRA